jgi:hypothetical protein
MKEPFSGGSQNRAHSVAGLLYRWIKGTAV